jgi:hypothetical protein
MTIVAAIFLWTLCACGVVAGVVVLVKESKK